MNNNFSRRFLERLQGNAIDKVDEGKLRSLASQMKPSDFEDEAKLRQILKTLASLSGKQLSEEKEDMIIQMFRDKEINLNDMSSLSKFLK